ncbi:MAG: tRNA (adenosine(37)-N6)-dimethylallyltransferase MiaA [Verrucomicrobia bacterium]|nr:tRNA (adenosine(37)-N6)-dimethylallyltransferase MiaA [Verrucomicrobiota bacterium]
MDEADPTLDRGRRCSDVLYLSGPTASGKSAVALALARRLNAEIVSVDSMQVYRGLDIGTAKPTVAEREEVPHHLLDIADLDSPFDAARFCRLAEEAVRGIRQRGRRILFCGGTGLYFKAWMEGVGAMPPADPALRAELNALPLDELLSELERRDPQTHARIDRKNPRRVVRALEVVRLTGRSFVAQQSPWRSEAGASGRRPDFFYLDREPADLEARIRARVAAMLEAGWVEETRRALLAGLEKNATAFQAIGYRQILEHIRGQRSLAETRELIQSRTRQFARRQGIWFRKHGAPTRLAVAADETAESVASRILA